MSATHVAAADTPSLALDRFEPAPAGDRMFGVPSPYAAGAFTPHVMLLGDYAHDPLIVHENGTSNSPGAVVSSQLYLNLDVGLALWNRLMLDVDVPVALAQGGDNPPAGTGQTFASPSGAQFGDLRLGARVRLFGEYHDAFQLALGGYLWLPTGAKDAFVSAGTVRGLPQLILGGRIHERVVWSAAAGPELLGSGTYGNVEQGSMFRFGAGAGLLLLDDRSLQIGPELSGDVVLRQVSSNTTNAELLFDLRYRIAHTFELAGGIGPGLTSGVGTPGYRALLSFAYTPEPTLAPPAEADRDHDGILDGSDACPDVPGAPSPDPAKNGCPAEADADHDGILDGVDACPQVPGVADPDPTKNGCPRPADRDHDGIADAADACPDVAGVAAPDPAKNGCPAPTDRDQDGITDAEDACPDEKGPRSDDPKRNGCPRVHVSDKEVVILEQIQFDTGRATIKAASKELLDAIADVMKAHGELTAVEVQGHTDSKGNKAANQRLSQARAASVVKALVERGVDPARLTAKGYGQTVPISSNDTEAGRALNRRVQFVITGKTAKAAPN
jgi:outer membrane protein OmpA-like peptidoglycan-associated protein